MTTAQTMTAAATLTRRDTGLVWGLKESFLAYVAGCPDGSVELSPGTGQLPDGSFYFSPDPDAPDTALHFRGGVRLRAHAGMLDVCLADPRVEGTDGRPVLTAETWKDGVWQRIPFAAVSWTPSVGGTDGDAGGGAAAGRVRTLLARTRLHPEATALFDDTYPAGEVFSVLLVRIPLEGSAS